MKSTYFNWMCALIGAKKPPYNKYNNLLRTLHQVDFEYILPKDASRLEDGIDLRYHYAYENDIPDFEVASGLDLDKCSVLEMMVALARRIETDIMGDPEIGDRTSIWFWDMIKNMGLDIFTDKMYDEETVIDIIDCFLDREYERDGTGGLFYLPNHGDVRNIDIWYQMQYYLNDI